MVSYEDSIPKRERLWVQIFKEGAREPSYLITSDIPRYKYFLYKVNKGHVEKTNHSSDDPRKLEELIRRKIW